MNEEEIKAKLVLPFLKDLGIGEAELTFEKSFSVRLGRTIKEIEDNFHTTGRLDVLCKAQGRNLFVIEVKSDELDISDDDIKQGISYARLLDQIAPFVLVTNGRDTRVIDTITQMDIDGPKLSEQSDFWANGCTLSTKEDLEIRYDALRHFILFSSDNLRLFCESQIESRMNPIIGSIHNLYAKYVKELYIPRRSLVEEFHRFLESDLPVFAIVGEAGTGKSAAICDLCISYCAEAHFAMFFNGTLLPRPPLELVCNDLNLFFSDNSYRDGIIRKLESLASRLDSAIVLFIDAVDEADVSGFTTELSDLARALESTSSIRLCITCKKAVWPNMLIRRGVKTHLYRNIYTPEKVYISQDHRLLIPGIQLGVFDDTELEAAIEKYTNAYNNKGQFSTHMLKILRNPLLLRLTCQIYENRTVPSEMQYNEILYKYLHYIAEKVGPDSYESIITVLVEVARLQFEKEADSATRESTVTRRELCENLGITPLGELPEWLFSFNLLLIENRDVSSVVRFYITLLRDYIVCIHLFQLETKTDEELEEILPKLVLGPVGLGALYYYSRNACPAHIEVINKHARMNAYQYVCAYEDYLNTRYFNIKQCFEPYTNGLIGLIIVDSDVTLFGPYALFPLASENDAKMVILPAEGTRYDEAVFRKYRAPSLHFSMNNLIAGGIETAVESNVREQLVNIINEGSLVEEYSELLLMEKIASIMYFYRKELGYSEELQYMTIPRMNSIYPIDLYDVKHRIYREFARVHFKSQQVKDLIENGTIKVVNNSYSVSREMIDEGKLTLDIENAAKRGIPMPEPRIGGSYPPFVDLYRAVNCLIDAGHSILEKHYLPCPDVPLEEYRTPVSIKPSQIDWHELCILNQYTPEGIAKYIEAFFTLLDIAYCEVVDRCLPFEKGELEFYQTLPHRYNVFLSLDSLDPNFRFGYGYCSSESDESVVHVSNEMPSFEESREICGKLGLETFTFSSIDSIMYDSSPTNGSGFFLGTRNSHIEYTRMLRNWVYKLLQEEVKAT